MWFDVEHACAELDWRPRFSNEEMLAESYDWYVANRPRVEATAASASASPHRRAPRSGLLSLVKSVWRTLPS
jgi:hypothetical protein